MVMCLSSEPPLPSPVPPRRSTRARRLTWRHSATGAVFIPSPIQQAARAARQGRRRWENQAQTNSSAACLGQEAWVALIKHRGHFLEGIASGAWLHSRAAARSVASSRQRLTLVIKHCKTGLAASFATSPTPQLRSSTTYLQCRQSTHNELQDAMLTHSIQVACFP